MRWPFVAPVDIDLNEKCDIVTRISQPPRRRIVGRAAHIGAICRPTFCSAESARSSGVHVRSGSQNQNSGVVQGGPFHVFGIECLLREFACVRCMSSCLAHQDRLHGSVYADCAQYARKRATRLGRPCGILAIVDPDVAQGLRQRSAPRRTGHNGVSARIKSPLSLAAAASRGALALRQGASSAPCPANHARKQLAICAYPRRQGPQRQHHRLAYSRSRRLLGRQSRLYRPRAIGAPCICRVAFRNPSQRHGFQGIGARQHRPRGRCGQRLHSSRDCCLFQARLPKASAQRPVHGSRIRRSLDVYQRIIGCKAAQELSALRQAPASAHAP